MSLKSITLFLSLFLFVLLTENPSLHAQSSILDQMMRIQNAVVEVKAENDQYFKSPSSKQVRDPKTGRMVVMRTLSHASYERKGTGVNIDPSGVIVTNGHTVTKAEHIIITLQDGRSFPAQVVRFAGDLDFALLKIAAPNPLPFVLLANSNEIKLGEDIVTIGGSPLLNRTISGGRITGLGTNREQKTNGENMTDVLQTNINIYKGDSGGPLFDKKGRLIGLMTAKLNSINRSSFAIPSNKIALYLSAYLNEVNKR